MSFILSLPLQAVNDPPEWVKNPGKTIANFEEWTTISPIEAFDRDENDLSCTVPFLTVTLNAIGGYITLGEADHPGIVVLPVSNSSYIVFQGQSTWINQALLSLKFQPTTAFANQDMETATTCFLSRKLEDDGSCGRGGVLHTVSVWPIDVKPQISTPPVLTVLAALSNEDQWVATDEFNADGWAILALNEDVPVQLPGLKLSSSLVADRLFYVEILGKNGALTANFTSANAEACKVNITVDSSGKWLRFVGLVDDLNCALEDSGRLLFEPSSFGLWQTFSDTYMNSKVVLAPSDPRLCRVDIAAGEEIETSELLPTTSSVAVHISVLDINHAPTVDAPLTIAAIFSQPLTIPGIQVHDIDMMSPDCGDGRLEVTIEAILGNVNVPLEACIRCGITDFYNNQKQVQLVASVHRMNNILASVTYEAMEDDFYGTFLEDTIHITVSDQGFCGEGGIKSNSTSISVSISHQQSNEFFMFTDEDDKAILNLMVEVDEDKEAYLPWNDVINRQGYNNVTSDVEISCHCGHVLLGPNHEPLLVQDNGVLWTSYVISTTKNLSSEESLTSDIITDEIQHLELQTGWHYEVQQVK